MNCYKCGSDQDLSIKKHRRTGDPVFMCRPCRRAYYHKTKFKPQPLKVEFIVDEGWRERAMEINNRIARKYVP